MEPDLRRSMLRYYDERALETKEAYVRGTGTASIPDPEVFRREASLLADVVTRFAHGRILDLACGTGYWLPHYAERCSSITLLDQSGKMLDECRKKTEALGVTDDPRLSRPMSSRRRSASARTTVRSSVSCSAT